MRQCLILTTDDTWTLDIQNRRWCQQTLGLERLPTRYLPIASHCKRPSTLVALNTGPFSVCWGPEGNVTNLSFSRVTFFGSRERSLEACR